MSKNKESSSIAVNKKARHLYNLSDFIEAGISLTGPEVKHSRGQGQFYRQLCRFQKWRGLAAFPAHCPLFKCRVCPARSVPAKTAFASFARNCQTGGPKRAKRPDRGACENVLQKPSRKGGNRAWPGQKTSRPPGNIEKTRRRARHGKRGQVGSDSHQPPSASSFHPQVPLWFETSALRPNRPPPALSGGLSDAVV